MSRAENKAERLLQMETLLLAHPEGMTQAEMARRLEVDRSVIHRNLYDFQKLYPTIQHEDGRISLDRSAYLVKVAFTLHEATAVHLAARLLATRMDRQNPHAASALRKLGVALEKLAPRISSHVKQAADVVDDASQWQDPRYLDVLEKLTLAWAEQRKVKVWHRSDKAGKVFEYFLCPHFIEPYAVGQTTHLIARDESTGKMRTLKIERIEKVELTQERYEIPADFDPRDLLTDAWGIWYTENEPVEVTLKFNRNVAGRLKETRWHRSQQPLEEMRDGSIIWKAKVAEPQEMVPWIRSWGADCEVVGPKGLREALEKEARRMAEVYKVMEVKKEFIAHIRKQDKTPQSLDEHLAAVSKLAGQFADKIGLKEVGEVLGLLHDFGKASEKFQRYILSGEGFIDPDAEEYLDPVAHKGKIDHTTAGAQVIYENLWNKGQKEKITAQVLALCIASHHSGLIDCLKPDGENDFKRRMEKADENTRKSEALSNLQEIETAIKDLLSAEVIEQLVVKLQSLKEETNESRNNLDFKAGLLVRFLLSCLIDADRLDTADFETPGNARIRNYGQYRPWETLIERLENRLKEFEIKNEVDELRAQVSQACLDYAVKPKGIYQLTVPTGGGKTLASLRFALNHAKQHSMERVFYVIPFTSIIDQNAEEIRKILEDKDASGKYLDKVVLEHHSNLTPEEETRRQNLLAQNWDAPVVLTTQVQFLEALFGGHTRSPRRMHQLANSVIILDEVQTIPINMIHMLNLALRFLVHTCGATIVLCTATQPPLDKLENPYRALIINPEQRIIQDEKELFARLKRVEVFDKRRDGGWNEEEVAELAENQLQEKGSVLIVVNTKKSAKALYQAVADRKIAGAHLYHLSTNMCPAHRLNILNEIKEKLKPENGEPVICVSTQLIEAGVDIDFGAVIRYLAGLDSIAQSAGRCNRHGVREGLGNVWIVNPKDENINKLKDIVIGTEKAQRVLDDFKKNPEEFRSERIGLNAMAAYYQYYYFERRSEMEYKVGVKSSAGQEDTLFNLLSTNTLSMEAHKRTHTAPPEITFLQSFQTAAKEFQVIDSPTRGVVVEYGDEGKEIVADLCGAPELEKQFKLLKKAQRYSVNLHSHEFDKLYKMGAIHEVQEGTDVFHLDQQYYSENFGWNDEIVNDMEFLSVS